MLACWLFFAGGAHAAPYAGGAVYRALPMVALDRCGCRRPPAPAKAGLSLFAGLRYFGLLGGNVSQFCALFRLFWRKRDWNCATLPHPGDDTPPEPPRSSAQLSSLPVIWQNSPRFCSSVVVDFAFARSKTQYRNIGTVHYPSRLSFRYHQLRI